MTDEHLWFQGKLLEICQRLNYGARLESEYADVRVASDPPYALEVQRVSANFGVREEQRRARGMNTLWFLPETRKQKSQGDKGDPLFTHPCVRLRYYDATRHNDFLLQPDFLSSQVWNGRREDGVELKVAVTLWKPKADGLSFEREGTPMSVEPFLAEVLSGQRKWYQELEIHERKVSGETWAGWVLTRDMEMVRGNRDQRNADPRRVREIESRERQDMQRHQAEHAARCAALEAERANALRAELEKQQARRVTREVERDGALRAEFDPQMVHPAEIDEIDDKIQRPWWKRIWRAFME